VETRLEKAEKIGAKIGWHFKFLWGAAGGILMAMYSLFIKK
jgi:tetrahydromethanopterin S-methyltransferase subunit G